MLVGPYVTGSAARRAAIAEQKWKRENDERIERQKTNGFLYDRMVTLRELTRAEESELRKYMAVILMRRDGEEPSIDRLYGMSYDTSILQMVQFIGEKFPRVVPLYQAYFQALNSAQHRVANWDADADVDSLEQCVSQVFRRRRALVDELLEGARELGYEMLSSDVW